MRELGVRTKLNALTRNVRGKRLILVDDSIVRGTTSRKIVEMLRTAGAKEVHMRISSPSVLNSCYFGIDTATSEELIGHRAGAGLRHRRRGHQAQDRLPAGQARHRGHRLRGHVRQRRHLLRGAQALFFLDYIACGKNVPEKIAQSSPAWRRAACRRAAPWSAARPPRSRCPRRTTTWPASPWAWWTRQNH